MATAVTTATLRAPPGVSHYPPFLSSTSPHVAAAYRRRGSYQMTPLYKRVMETKFKKASSSSSSSSSSFLSYSSTKTKTTSQATTLPVSQKENMDSNHSNNNNNNSNSNSIKETIRTRVSNNSHNNNNNKTRISPTSTRKKTSRPNPSGATMIQSSLSRRREALDPHNKNNRVMLKASSLVEPRRVRRSVTQKKKRLVGGQRVAFRLQHLHKHEPRLESIVEEDEEVDEPQQPQSTSVTETEIVSCAAKMKSDSAVPNHPNKHKMNDDDPHTFLRPPWWDQLWHDWIQVVSVCHFSLLWLEHSDPNDEDDNDVVQQWVHELARSWRRRPLTSASLEQTAPNKS